MKKTLTLIAASIAMSSISASAALLVGFETWLTNPNSNGATNTHTSNTVGFTGLSTTVGSTWGRGSAGAHTDGTFGTLAGADTGTTFRSGATLNNGNNGSYDFAITNNSPDDYELEFFHFDTGTFRPNAAHEWTLSIQSGDLTAQTITSGNAENITGGVVDWYDYDIDLSSITGGNVLAVGESVTFRLDMAGGTGASGQHQYLDNIGVSGIVPIPEPSSAALLGLCALGLLARRR